MHRAFTFGFVGILIHRLAHVFDLHHGNAETWWSPDCMTPGARLMAGFRCSTCGALSGVHEVRNVSDATYARIQERWQRRARERQSWR